MDPVCLQFWIAATVVQSCCCSSASGLKFDESIIINYTLNYIKLRTKNDTNEKNSVMKTEGAVVQIEIILFFFCFSSDTVFFHLPPRSGDTKCVYGVSCYRQIEAKVSLSPPQTHTHTQISVNAA